MGKSARVLGWEFGKTAAEMNRLFKEHGYLEGEPGAYRLTEKGEQFAEEQYHTNGYGGYARRDWETRTWNDEAADALRADIEASPETDLLDSETELAEDFEPIDLVDFEYDPDSDYPSNDDTSPWGWKELVIAGSIVGAVLIAPHIKPFYQNKLRPAMSNLRSKLTKPSPNEDSVEEEDTPQ